MKQKFKFLMLIFAIMIFCTINSNVKAKDLVYKATITTDSADGSQYMTFRKYVRHYGSSSDTDWDYDCGKLSGQSTSTKGSYVTQAMVFHKNYGTNYVWWSDKNDVVDVAHDKTPTGVEIDTSDTPDNAPDFFTKYSIEEEHAFVKLGSQSKDDVGWEKIYESGDIDVARERILGNVAITDFKISGNTYNELMNTIHKNVYYNSDGNYEVKVSGKLQAMNENGKYFENVSSTQDLIDIMIPEWTQAYVKFEGETQINSVWSGNDFGYTSKKRGSPWKKGNSVLNNFDNKLIVPAEKGRVVYVQHVMDGTSRSEILWNNEYVQQNGVASVVDSSDLSRGWMEKYFVSSNASFTVKAIEKSADGNIYLKNGRKVYLSDIKYREISDDGILTGEQNDYFNSNNKSGNNIDSGSYTVPGSSTESKSYAVVFYYSPVEETKTYSMAVSHLIYNTQTKNISSLEQLSSYKSYILTDMLGKENALLVDAAGSKSVNIDSVTSADGKGGKSVEGAKTYCKIWFNSSAYDAIALRSSSGNSSYKYVGYKIGKGSSREEAAKNLKSAPFCNDSTEQTFLNYDGETTYIFFYYEPISSYVPTPSSDKDIENFNADVYLDHINTKNSEYSDATDNEYSNTTNASYASGKYTDTDLKENADIIPSYGEFTSYLRAAPYIVKAANISSEKVSSTARAEVDVVIYMPMGKHGYMQEVIPVTFEVPYEYTKFVINNLKLYKLKTATMYDDSSNKVLGANSKSLELSDEYNKKIDNKNNGLKKGYGELTLNFEEYFANQFKNIIGASRYKYVDRIFIGDIFMGLTNHNRIYYDIPESTDYMTAFDDAKQKIVDAVEKMSGKIDSSYDFSSGSDNYEIDGNKLFGDSEEKSGNVSLNIEKINIKTVGRYREITIGMSKISFGGSTNLSSYTSNVKKYMNEWDSSKLTTYKDFNEDYTTLSNVINGVRNLSATAVYEIAGGNLNVGSDNFKANVYYSGDEVSVDGSKVVDVRTDLLKENTIDINDVDSSGILKNSDLRVRKIQVYTPIVLGDWKDMMETEEYYDSTIEGTSDRIVLQADADFTIKPKFKEYTGDGYSSMPTTDHVQGCYYIFSFKVIHKGTTYNAGTPIYVDGIPQEFVGRTTTDFGELSYNSNQNPVRIIAVSKNGYKWPTLKDWYANNLVFDANDLSISNNNSNYEDNTYVSIDRSLREGLNEDNQTGSGESLVNYIKGSSNHAVTSVPGNSMVNVGRIYDFRITDCTDLAWQDIFKTTDSEGVNVPTGKVYHSGTNRWMSFRTTRDQFGDGDDAYNKYNTYISNNIVINSDSYNLIMERQKVEDNWGIGSTGQRTLPIGPYKNISNSYVYAPKLGYRISFDVKTTGILNTKDDLDKRSVKIIPRYYYISKDGNTYIKDIDLYYKNMFGVYVKLKENELVNASSADFSSRYINNGGKEYSIYFKPDDGYRYKQVLGTAGNTKNLTNKLTKLNISEITLNKTMMTTDDSYVQVWFGEYKLPNSTIAVKSGESINNPLNDGYIGVIFDIYCVDEGLNKTLYYAQNNNKRSSLYNTSQWDYEGFLGVTPGNRISASNPLRLQLEKGDWIINEQSLYEEIKGTVILYDTDQRAANDFN